MKRENLLKSISRMRPTQWTWLAASLLAGFLAYYLDQTASGKADARVPEAIESAATFIPAGYVLVPIEIANYESLDSILGKFGIVDLYLPSDDAKKPAKKVAHHLRILRAPLNPSQFAVLAKEEESSRLVTHEGPFTVVIKNPNHTATSLANTGNKKTKKKPHSRITVEATTDDEN